MELRELINYIQTEFRNNFIYGNGLVVLHIVKILENEILEKNIIYKNDYIYFEDVEQNKKYKWNHFFISCNEEIFDPVIFHQQNFQNFQYYVENPNEYVEIHDDQYEIKNYFFNNLNNPNYYRMIHFLTFKIIDNVLKYFQKQQYLPSSYTSKIYPNERCPCGSNKKFKKCVHQSIKL